MSTCHAVQGQSSPSPPLLVGCSKRMARPWGVASAWIMTRKWGLFIMPITFQTSLQGHTESEPGFSVQHST